MLIAAIALLFTGRYPDSLYRFIMGMDRWTLRVAAYAWLMTDAYPPFRLDQGGTDPGSQPAWPTPLSCDASSGQPWTQDLAGALRPSRRRGR